MESAFRTDALAQSYREYRASGGKSLYALPVVREYKRWKLVQNEFPYDKLAQEHLMLLPKRNFQFEWQMDMGERAELTQIKREFAEKNRFDTFMENIGTNRTVASEYHIHCIKLYDHNK